MDVHGEAELLRQVVPGEDGLVIAWRGSRATFLPKVWNQIDDPRDFLRRLKLKAGWTAGFWDPDVEVWRYRTIRGARPIATVAEAAVRSGGAGRAL
jgi:AMMECR1 domain-containing protein